MAQGGWKRGRGGERTGTCGARIRIAAALASMDEMQRRVFERVRFLDQDYSYIAAEFGITVDAVERLFALALAHLDREIARGD